MKIPGLGCLKGCLFVIVVLVIGSWLIWELTPLKDWIAEGQSYWDAVTGWAQDVQKWIEDLGGPGS